MKILSWVFISFCLFGTNNAFAETSCMRCQRGKKMVCIESPASTVLAKCGSPLSIVEIGPFYSLEFISNAKRILLGESYPLKLAVNLKNKLIKQIR